MLHTDAITELRIQNAKDAYVALFNALGPMHYATLKAAFDVAEALMEDADDMEGALPYLKDAYEGLIDRDAEVREEPWKVGVYYALALMAVEQSRTCLEVSETLIEKYPDLAENDITSYLFLQEFRCSIYRALMDEGKFAELTMETYKTIVKYLDPSNPKYMHWLMLALLGLHVIEGDELARNLIKIERDDNTIEDEVISELFDVTLDMIETFVFEQDEETMKEELKDGFRRLVKTEEFTQFDEDEMREYFSALSTLFVPIQDEVGLEVETDDDEED